MVYTTTSKNTPSTPPQTETMPAKSTKQKQPKKEQNFGNFFGLLPTTPTRRRSSSRRRSSIKRRLSSKQRHAKHAKTTARHGERLFKQEELVNLMGDKIAKGKADRKSDINKLKKELEEIRKHNNGDQANVFKRIYKAIVNNPKVSVPVALAMIARLGVSSSMGNLPSVRNVAHTAAHYGTGVSPTQVYKFFDTNKVDGQEGAKGDGKKKT
jgi:hypothetical protein